ncbi:MAG: phage tail tape measure protein, partial [Alphaproteobacteria bacterium]
MARVAVAAVQAYGAANLTATEAVDKLTAIVREGNLAAEELAPALGRVLPIAAALGVSFDEVGANVAAFTRLGISAAESVTALRSLLSKILKPSEQADEALAQMGLTIDDLRASIAEQGLAATLQSLIQAADGNTEALGRLFGNVEGLANALGTAGAQGEEYLRIVQSISNANGIVDEGFQKVAETVNFQLRKALVDLQRSGEQFGAVVLPLVTDLLRQVTPLAKAFGDLDESTKKSIVSVALGAAAVGPLTTGLGALVRGVSTARAAVTSFAGGMRIAADTFASVREAVAATGGRLTRFTGITQAATAAWKAFDSTTKATVIGLVAAGVIALTAALVKMTRQLSGAQAIQRQLNEVNLEAEKAIAAERLEAERLVNVLKDSKRPYNERRKALDRLIDISPKYFSALNLEKSSVEEISKAYDAYVDNLFRVAHARAVQDRIVAIEKKRIELIHRLNELTKQLEKHTNAAVRGFLNFSPLGARTELLRKQIADLEAQQRSLAETFLETAPQIIESTESIADQTPTAPPKPPFKPSTPTDGGQPAARRTLLDVPDL